jgi:serine racemase
MLFSKISGNHAAALSLAAKIRGIPAFIVVPKSAPSCKVENIKRYDGNVNLAEDNMQSREEVMNRVRQETGAIYIPSSNDGRIMR